MVVSGGGKVRWLLLVGRYGRGEVLVRALRNWREEVRLAGVFPAREVFGGRGVRLNTGKQQQRTQAVRPG